MAAPESNEEELARRFNEAAALQAAAKQAALRVILDHARQGRRIVVWRNGEAVLEHPAPKSKPNET